MLRKTKGWVFYKTKTEIKLRKRERTANLCTEAMRVWEQVSFGPWVGSPGGASWLMSYSWLLIHTTEGKIAKGLNQPRHKRAHANLLELSALSSLHQQSLTEENQYHNPGAPALRTTCPRQKRWLGTAPATTALNCLPNNTHMHSYKIAAHLPKETDS